MCFSRGFIFYMGQALGSDLRFRRINFATRHILRSRLTIVSIGTALVGSGSFHASWQRRGLIHVLHRSGLKNAPDPGLYRRSPTSTMLGSL